MSVYQNIEIVMIEKKKNNPSTMDFHAHKRYELFYCLSGAAQLTLYGNNTDNTEPFLYKISPNEFVLIGENVLHKIENTEKCEHIVMEFKTISQHFANEPTISSLLTNCCLKLTDTKNILFYLKKIRKNITFDEQFISSLSYCLFHEIKILFNEQISSQPSGNVFIKHAVSFIVSNLANDIHSNDITAYCQVSSQYLNKLFNEYFQCSFMAFLTKLRLQNSLTLLNESPMPINQIAKSVGFPNSACFIRNFTKSYGITPTEYRNQSSSSYRKYDLLETQKKFNQYTSIVIPKSINDDI